jgi:methanogenic corrinoid protein MtbC1
MYTIKETAARTGIPIELLRAWERRYGIVEPARTAGGYRLYDETAIDRLRTMRRLVDDGWSPSVAAGAVLRGDAPPALEPSAGPSGAVETPGSLASATRAALVDDFLGAAIALDPAAVELALDRMFASGTFETVVDETLLPALGALGDAWADGRLTVAGEHAASHAVLRRLAAAFQAAGRPPARRGSVLVGLPPGSHHELAALTFAVAARRAGLPVLYLGPDLPTADWVSTVEAGAATAAVIGAATRTDLEPAVEVARAIRAASPATLVAFGGRVAEAAAASLGDDPGPLVLPGGLVAAVDTHRTALAVRRSTRSA